MAGEKIPAKIFCQCNEKPPDTFARTVEVIFILAEILFDSRSAVKFVGAFVEAAHNLIVSLI